MNKGKFYWDRRPGYFLVKETGERIVDSLNYTGNIQEWYLTLFETIKDANETLLVFFSPAKNIGHIVEISTKMEALPKELEPKPR